MVTHEFDIHPFESRDGLEAVADHYVLGEESFASSKEEVLARTDGLLQKRPETHEILASTEKTLILLSAVDGWISTNYSPEYPLVSILHELGLQVPEESVDRHTISSHRVSDPPIDQEEDEASANPEDPWVYSSPEDTDAVMMFFDRFGFRSPLRRTRKKFGITEETENPYHVLVTHLDTDAFQRTFHSIAFVRFETDGAVIVLPFDSARNTRIHEYTHTQWFSLSQQSAHLAFYRGIEEALIEESTPYPDFYEEQRDILARFTYYIPQFHDFVIRAGGVSRDVDQMLRSLVRVFGLAGVEVATRLTPVTCKEGEHFYTKEQRQIFLSVSEARDLLS